MFKEQSTVERRSKLLREAKEGKKAKIVALLPLISRRVVNGIRTG